MCGKPADSREHIFKSRDLKRIFDQEGKEFENQPFHFGRERPRRIRSASAMAICSRVADQTSQPAKIVPAAPINAPTIPLSTLAGKCVLTTVKPTITATIAKTSAADCTCLRMAFILTKRAMRVEFVGCYRTSRLNQNDAVDGEQSLWERRAAMREAAH